MMKLALPLLGLLPALALATASANAATIVHIDSANPPGTFFFTTYATPTLSTVEANFGATTLGASTPFDYSFQFTLPLSGVGSGSISTSFSSAGSALTISTVIIDGTTYTLAPGAGGQSLVVGNFPIFANVLNTIEVIGSTGPSATAGTFDGTATFQAVPEPATWATFLLGFGFLGLGLRRKSARQYADA